MTDDDPTDEQIDSMLGRIDSLAQAALQDHPQRERAVEIIAAGGHVFARRDDEQVALYIGWLANAEMRPPDADPDEVIPLARVPRRILLGGATGRGDS